MLRIIFTGGGTAGHILPNTAVIKEVRTGTEAARNGNGGKIPNADCRILYIGSHKGLEKQICAKAGIDFDGIFTGKFRRYFSINNFFDLFKIPLGLAQALFILRRFKPQVVFSKGGYVAVPVVVAAKMLGIPVVIHEGDYIPGFANKICAKFADKICVTFPETRGFDIKKTILTGMPVRTEGDGGMKEERRHERPTVLIMGGSLGAESINRATWNILPKLLRHANIIHITGKGKTGIKSISKKLDNYKQIEHADEELFDFYAQSSLVVSRAGASAIAEIAANHKPSILIPLGKKASRGEQIANATYMQSIGASEIVYQNEKFEYELAQKIIALINDEKKLEKMSTSGKAFGGLCRNSARKIAKILLSYSH